MSALVDRWFKRCPLCDERMTRDYPDSPWYCPRDGMILSEDR